MQYTAAQFSMELDALRRVFDTVLVVDPVTAALLDPSALTPTAASHPLPPLDAQGRAWQPLCREEQVSLYLYRAVTVEGRACVLALGCEMPPAAAGDREANAFARMLYQYCEEMRCDPVTGVNNRRYLEEVYRREAAKAAEVKPLSAALVRVNEYEALCRDEDTAAVDRCLNMAAGLLRTAIDPAWEHAVLARLEGGVFLVGAAAEPAALEQALQTAAAQGRRQFSVTLARRGQFTLSVAAAGWVEAGSWETLLELAGQRLAAL